MANEPSSMECGCGAVQIEFHNAPECTYCGRAAIVSAPAERFKDKSVLPVAYGHIWYHRRKADFNDDLPKYSGALASNVMGLLWTLRWTLGTVLKRRRGS